jgi:hypothetical protein
VKYPAEVQERIDFLEKGYTVSEKPILVDIVHMYPGEIAFPNGYYDSRFFNLVGFNAMKRLKFDYGRHDGIFVGKGVKVEFASIFADGSTIIKLQEPAKIISSQAAYLELSTSKGEK